MMNRCRCLASVCLLALSAAIAPADITRGLKVRQVLGTRTSIPDYHALIIGINRYRHWQDLRQARLDAEEIESLLSERYGFSHVTKLYDEEATRVGMILALRRLAAKLTEKDALLIFYAGHGYFDELMNRGYWVPHEARERVDGQPATMDWLSNTDLQDFVGMTRARHVLVVSDSCFSGSLFRGGTPDLTSKEHAWYRRAISQPSRWAISSGDLEQVPDSSVFARKFVAALQYPLSPVFSASDLAGRIKVEVAGDSGAQPLFGRLQLDRDSAFGEFVFLDRHAPAETVPPPVEKTSPPARLPAPITITPIVPASGSLVVRSPINGRISLNGGRLSTITASRALRWPDLPAGMYEVEVTAGDNIWRDTVMVSPDRETVVDAFPNEQVVPPQPAPAATTPAPSPGSEQRTRRPRVH